MTSLLWDSFHSFLQQTRFENIESHDDAGTSDLETAVDEASPAERAFLLKRLCEVCVERPLAGSRLHLFVTVLRRLLWTALLEMGYCEFPDRKESIKAPVSRGLHSKRAPKRRRVNIGAALDSEAVSVHGNAAAFEEPESDEIQPSAGELVEPTPANRGEPKDELHWDSWPPPEHVVTAWLVQATESSFQECWPLPIDEWLVVVRESPASKQLKAATAERALLRMRETRRLPPPLIAAWLPLLMLSGTRRVLLEEALSSLLARDRLDIPQSVLELAFRRDTAYAKALLRIARGIQYPHPIWHREAGAVLFLLVASMPSFHATCTHLLLRKITEYLEDLIRTERTIFAFPNMERPRSPTQACMIIACSKPELLETILDLMSACLDANVVWPDSDLALFPSDALKKAPLRTDVAARILERIAVAPSRRLPLMSWQRLLLGATATQPQAFLSERSRQLLKEYVVRPETVPFLRKLMRYLPDLAETAIYQCRKLLFQASSVGQIPVARALASMVAFLGTQEQPRQPNFCSGSHKRSELVSLGQLLPDFMLLSLRILQQGSAQMRRVWYETIIEEVEGNGLAPAVVGILRTHFYRTFFTATWKPSAPEIESPLRPGSHWIDDDAASLLCLLALGHDMEGFDDFVARLSYMDLSHLDIPADVGDQPLDETDRGVLTRLLQTIETAIVMWPILHVAEIPDLSPDSTPGTVAQRRHRAASTSAGADDAAAAGEVIGASPTGSHESQNHSPGVPVSPSPNLDHLGAFQVAHPGGAAIRNDDLDLGVTELASRRERPTPAGRCQQPYRHADIHGENESAPAIASVPKSAGVQRLTECTDWSRFRTVIAPLLRLHQRAMERLGDPYAIWQRGGCHASTSMNANHDKTEAQHKTTSTSSKEKRKQTSDNDSGVGRSLGVSSTNTTIPATALEKFLALLTETLRTGRAFQEIFKLLEIALRRLLLVPSFPATMTTQGRLVPTLLQVVAMPLSSTEADTAYLLAILLLGKIRRSSAEHLPFLAEKQQGFVSAPTRESGILLAEQRQHAVAALLRSLRSRSWSLCVASAALLGALGPQAQAAPVPESGQTRWDTALWRRIRECLDSSRKVPLHPAIRQCLPAGGSDIRLLFHASLADSLVPTSWYPEQHLCSIAMDILQTWASSTVLDWNVLRLFTLQLQSWLQEWNWLVERGYQYSESTANATQVSQHILRIWADWACALSLVTTTACGDGTTNLARVSAPELIESERTLVPVVAVAPWTFIRTCARTQTLGFQSLVRVARAVHQKRIALCRPAWKRMTFVASQGLATAAYDLLTAATEPTAEESAAKIRDESQLFPQLIYALESAEKALFATSQTYRDPGLVRRLRRPVARDFKLAAFQT